MGINGNDYKQINQITFIKSNFIIKNDQRIPEKKRFRKPIMEMYQLSAVYHYIIFRHLHLNHQKSINLHSLICYILEYELSDSKIGNDKNIQSYREIM